MVSAAVRPAASSAVDGGDLPCLRWPSTSLSDLGGVMMGRADTGRWSRRGGRSIRSVRRTWERRERRASPSSWAARPPQGGAGRRRALPLAPRPAQAQPATADGTSCGGSRNPPHSTWNWLRVREARSLLRHKGIPTLGHGQVVVGQLGGWGAGEVERRDVRASRTLREADPPRPPSRLLGGRPKRLPPASTDLRCRERGLGDILAGSYIPTGDRCA